MGVWWEEPGLNKESIVSPEGPWNQRSGSQAVLFAQLCLAAVISVSLCLCLCRGAAVGHSFKGPVISFPEMSVARMCFWKQWVAQEVDVCLYSYSLIRFEWKANVCFNNYFGKRNL